MKWKELLARYKRKRPLDGGSPNGGDFSRKAGSLQDLDSPREVTVQRVKTSKKWGRLPRNVIKTPPDMAKTVQRYGTTNRECWVFEVTAGVDRGRQFVGITHEIKIGRQFDNHIQLNDPKVSRFHAVITQKGSHMVVHDLKSTNGTWINNERVVREKRLQSGDRIKVGETVLNVRYENE